MDAVKQIDNLKREIIAEAETKIQKINDDVTRWIKEYEQKILAEVDQERERILTHYEQSEKSASARVVAQARMDARNRRLAKENELTERLITRAREDLSALRTSENYPEMVKGFIIEAVNQVEESEIEVMIDPRDEKLITADLLSSIEIIFTFSYNRAVKLNLSATKINTAGGVIIKTLGKNLFINNTFEERFRLAEDEIRREIAKSVFE